MLFIELLTRVILHEILIYILLCKLSCIGSEYIYVISLKRVIVSEKYFIISIKSLPTRNLWTVYKVNGVLSSVVGMGEGW